MKNFPHQFNQIDRIHAALKVFKELRDGGGNLNDDTAVGRRLAERGVYQFRDKSSSISENLAKENAKPRSSRGTETCARELRRMFDLLGLLKPDHSALSASGEELAATDDAETQRRLLRHALQNLALPDEQGNISHPYRILLRLVGARPGIPGELLGLCLEAADDSEEEFERLLSIVDADYVDHEDAFDALGVTPAMARNSIKVLPPLARQLGDIIADDANTHRLPQPQDDASAHKFAGTRSPRRPRAVTSGEIAAWQRTEADPDDPRLPTDPDALRREIELRARRTERHNQLVRAFAAELELAGLDLIEYPFDCVGLGDGIALLCEMKSLDGTPEDERSQVCACLAQLSYYETFDLPVGINKATLRRVAVFESPPSTPHQHFLEAHHCVVIWRTPTGGFTGTQQGLTLLRGIGLT